MIKKKMTRGQKSWATRQKNKAEKETDQIFSDTVNLQESHIQEKDTNYSTPTIETRLNYIEEEIRYFTDRMSELFSHHYKLADKVDKLIKRIG